MLSVQADYPLARWRLIIDRTPQDGAWNMALDEAIMDAVGARESPPTIRFYQWRPPCLSLGKRQPLGGVDLERCAREGVDVVRRATGGWAILHTDEMTYSIAVPPDDPRADGALLDAYRKLSQGLVAGLGYLGVPAVLNPVVAGGVHNASAACFEVPSAYEITAGDRKLIGSAQTRPNGRVLQHGSLPLHGDIARVVSCLSFQTEEERAELAAHLRERATTLSDVIGRPVSFDEAAGAMCQGFPLALHLELDEGEPTAAELERAHALAEEKRALHAQMLAKAPSATQPGA